MPLDEVVFFTDRDLGKRLPELLATARLPGLRVERHNDHFAHDTPDDIWLPEVGHRGWYVLTHDQRIRYKPNEKAAVIENGIGLFVLIGKVPHQLLAEGLIAVYPNLLAFIDHYQRPFIAKIYRPDPGRRKGRVVLWTKD